MATTQSIDMGAISQLLHDAKELYTLIKSISNNESVDHDDIDTLGQLLSDMQDNVTDLESSIEDDEDEAEDDDE